MPVNLRPAPDLYHLNRAGSVGKSHLFQESLSSGFANVIGRKWAITRNELPIPDSLSGNVAIYDFYPKLPQLFTDKPWHRARHIPNIRILLINGIWKDTDLIALVEEVFFLLTYGHRQ